MKVLLVGDGAREHAMAEALANSPQGYRVYALSSYVNPGIREAVNRTGGKYVQGNINSREDVAKAIREFNPDFGVVGPEDPLFHGIADEFRRNGIPVVGPNRAGAEIERSKVWMRQLMWKYKIDGRLRFRSFTSLEEASRFIVEYGGSVAVKPAEQVGGKGVKVVADIQAYLSNEKRRALSKSVDEIGSLVKNEVKIIIEEKVDGPEYTLHVLTDGHTFLPLPLAQDYKHAYQDGIGPETGGMGSVSGPGRLLPFITEEEYEKTLKIVQDTARAIREETGEPYRGFISGQMMLTELWGPTVIEFYSRMGDPETSAIIPRISSDFGYLLQLTAEEKLSQAKLEVREDPTVVRAIAPLGYPLRREMATGKEIFLDVNSMREKGCLVYFGSVSYEGGKLITRGSRALELVAFGDFEEASRKLDTCTKMISANTELVYRTDIGRTLGEQAEKAEIVRYSYQNRIRRNSLGVSADWAPNGGLW
ncbi:phosphoribosylamine--glycine ligase [Metallosphaera sedula]|uniref:phosphoribosylamine--glycine ligase n=3 Tax=Metallosphaera TaxID=41980 RepID=A4YI71_METS5|nr:MULTISPECIES: phosphoribosylamine--glycine ligase [Metallosphaera]ABP96123.1 phosphoribosylamine--glycine ligase [Metallosphaera sedula DSM 5348]AIM28106.1 phosphoribosylamine--glycine ligase [Metallosphaera sedula]AKV74932.1 phosphoribosylamine--glycine ligase [Metallosphaera sedula]AKV77170.1 phosphoribosylamine--glycine ligase [Metallosphaera sedula]AKV79420.1 phosphoribosylamine--glycine ligase [Metallosphaera sedula]